LGDRAARPALSVSTSRALAVEREDALVGLLHEFSPIGIEDLTPQPLPVGGVWDPTSPPLPEAAPAPLHWRVVFSSRADRDRAARALADNYPEVQLERDEVPDDDWAERSQRELKAVRAGAFVVAPPWDVPSSAEPDVHIILIRPSRGFGTGHHASTRLCLRALSDTDVVGSRVVDVGTGSGVLAIAAALKGACRVTAIDVDGDAIESARENAALNRLVGSIEWRIGDFRELDFRGSVLEPSDLVLANLTGGMLIASTSRLRSLIRPGGLLIASGFDVTERPAVEEALQLRTRTTLSEEGWIGLVLSA